MPLYPPPVAPLDDTDPALVDLLRALGDRYGPLGVAVTAVLLSDPGAVERAVRKALRRPLFTPEQRAQVGEETADQLERVYAWAADLAALAGRSYGPDELDAPPPAPRTPAVEHAVLGSALNDYLSSRQRPGPVLPWRRPGADA